MNSKLRRLLRKVNMTRSYIERYFSKSIKKLSKKKYLKSDKIYISEIVKTYVKIIIVMIILIVIVTVFIGYLIYYFFLNRLEYELLESMDYMEFETVRNILLKFVFIFIGINILIIIFFLTVFFIYWIYSEHFQRKIEIYFAQELQINTQLRNKINQLGIRFIKSEAPYDLLLLGVVVLVNFVSFWILGASMEFIFLMCLIMFGVMGAIGSEEIIRILKEMKLGKKEIMKIVEFLFWHFLILIFRSMIVLYLIIPLLILIDEIIYRSIILNILNNIFFELQNYIKSTTNSVPEIITLLGNALKQSTPNTILFLKSMSIYLPYCFLLFLIVGLFSYLIPMYSIGGIKNRRIKVFLSSLIIGFCIANILNWTIPKIFMLNLKSIFYSIILALIASFFSELIESKLEDFSEDRIICSICKEENPENAKYCMFCGKILDENKKN